MKNQPNRLMQGMIGVSVIIHLLIFARIAHIYRSENLTVIELSMKDTDKPVGRVIPRPRRRIDPPTVTEPDMAAFMIPRFALPEEDTALSESMMGTVEAPQVSPDTTAGLSGLFAGDGQGFFIRKDYFDMVRMKIESAKIYPESARGKLIEGRVTLRFTILPDGQVTSLKIFRYSGNRSLDQAALKAVEDAAPFARPPSSLFQGPLPMELAITFELT